MSNGSGQVGASDTAERASSFFDKTENNYRNKEQVKQWKEKDPVDRCKSKLLEAGVPDMELENIKAEIKTSLQEDKAWALQQPFATFGQATDHVWIPL